MKETIEQIVLAKYPDNIYGNTIDGQAYLKRADWRNCPPPVAAMPEFRLEYRKYIFLKN